MSVPTLHFIPLPLSPPPQHFANIIISQYAKREHLACVFCRMNSSSSSFQKADTLKTFIWTSQFIQNLRAQVSFVKKNHKIGILCIVIAVYSTSCFRYCLRRRPWRRMTIHKVVDFDFTKLTYIHPKFRGTTKFKKTEDCVRCF